MKFSINIGVLTFDIRKSATGEYGFSAKPESLSCGYFETPEAVAGRIETYVADAITDMAADSGHCVMIDLNRPGEVLNALQSAEKKAMEEGE